MQVKQCIKHNHSPVSDVYTRTYRQLDRPAGRVAAAYPSRAIARSLSAVRRKHREPVAICVVKFVISVFSQFYLRTIDQDIRFVIIYLMLFIHFTHNDWIKAPRRCSAKLQAPMQMHRGHKKINFKIFPENLMNFCQEKLEIILCPLLP